MQNHTKVAVIGGTGKSGRYLVQGLLSQGFCIKMLVRNVEAFIAPDPLIEVVQGDARHFETIRSLIRGCQAVISTLGQPKAETPIFSHATTNVIRSMQEYGIRRYILIAGVNVDDASDKKSSKTAFATEWMKTNYPQTTADRQRELEILLASDLDWTLIRLPLIELTAKKREIKASLFDCPGDKISAADLADFLIAQLSTDVYSKKSPFIANV